MGLGGPRQKENDIVCREPGLLNMTGQDIQQIGDDKNVTKVFGASIG